MDLGKILQGYFDLYRSRGLTTQEFFNAVEKAYIESGQSKEAANYLANQYADYATTGKSLNGPEVTPFHNPLQPGGGTTGAGTTGAGADDKAFWRKVGFAETDPQAAWQRGLGLPVVGQNPFQEWQTGQASPAFAGWGARAAALPLGITPIPGQGGQVPGNEFADYISPTGAQRGQTEALSVLDRLRNQSSEKQNQWMETVGSKGGPGLEGILNAAMRGKGYAGFVANSMANRLPALKTGWSAQTMGGAEGGTQPGATLLDYLMKRMGF